MPLKKKSDWTIEKIKQMLEDGMRYTEIAEYFNLSKQRVKQLVVRHGLPTSVSIYQKNKTETHFAKWGNKADTDLYNACRAKFRAKKANAKHTGYDWTIEFGDLKWPTHCPILGLELDYFAETRMENSPSFDRLDSNRGYVTGNVVVVSWRANRIKNDGSLEEHKRIVEYLENLK